MPRRGCPRSTPPGSSIGEPDRRAAYDRDRAVSAAMARRDADAAAAAAPRPTPRRRGRHDDAGVLAAAPRASRRSSPATGPSGDRPSVAGTTRRCARRTGPARLARHPATRRGASSPSGAMRLVAGRDRPQRPRLHRVAGPDADRPAVSRRARCDPAADRAPSLSPGRCDRPTGPVPPPLIRPPSAAAASASASPAGPPRPAGTGR